MQSLPLCPDPTSRFKKTVSCGSDHSWFFRHKFYVLSGTVSQCLQDPTTSQVCAFKPSFLILVLLQILHLDSFLARMDASTFPSKGTQTLNPCVSKTPLFCPQTVAG